MNTTARRTRIRENLIRWYRREQRDLPWRKTKDPYRILVSEVMLQQTQVDRVIPKYRAFLRSFPTVRKLARARTASVIRAWSGLGYNRRAVNLQRAAQVIVRDHRGKIPNDVEALEAIPGIGPYTARAVTTFAMYRYQAFIDTNVRRIVGRVLRGKHYPTQEEEKQLLPDAERLVPPRRPAEWHHALMDLGAMVCKPKPKCNRCPLRNQCRSYPTIHEQPQRRMTKPTAKFEDSDRYWRGKILAALTSTTVSAPLLRKRLPSPISVLRLRKLLAVMEKDGLVRMQKVSGKRRFRLP